MGLLDFSLSDLGGVITGVREAITGEKIKDPVEMAKVELQLRQIETALKSGQLEINKIEAGHPSIFVAGWRPAIGWVAAGSLALMYIPKAIVMTFIWTYKCYVLLSEDINAVIPDFPNLGTMEIIGLVASMLGVAGMRSYDKLKGSDTKKIK
jgi:hypothetical protein